MTKFLIEPFFPLYINWCFFIYRQAKIDGQVANAKLEEMMALKEKLHSQLERKVFQRKESFLLHLNGQSFSEC